MLIYKPLKGQILNSKYKVVKKIGSGGFSQIWKCKMSDGTLVAIKIFNSEDFESGRNEYKLVKQFDHENIIGALDRFIYVDNAPTTVKYYCIVYELCQMELNDILPIKNTNVARTIMKNILGALEQVHIRNIIHYDLKPENILIKDGTIKLCDFSLSRYTYVSSNKLVATSYYRPPEMLVGINMSRESDMWAVGCILFEIITGETLFKPKKYQRYGICSYADHIAQIIELRGQFPKWMSCGTRYYRYFKKNGKMKKIHIVPIELSKVLTLFNIHDYELLDLLQKLLTIDPKNRITCSEALKHSWLVS